MRRNKRRTKKKWSQYRVYNLSFKTKPYPIGEHVLTPPSPLSAISSMLKVLESKPIDTKAVREKMIRNLEQLLDFAHRKATDPELSPKARQSWARLETYIAQTLNSIVNDYDIVSIKKKLEELKKIAEELDL